MAKKEKLYRIGELAKLAGVNKSVIDHYTRLGLLTPARRSGGSYRLYSRKALERIQFINACKENRLSLAEIREVMKGEPSTETTEVGLYMAQAALAIDQALLQLNSAGEKLAVATAHDADTVKSRAAMLMLKVLAISELLQMLSQQL